jgi:hypothetical protein
LEIKRFYLVVTSKSHEVSPELNCWVMPPVARVSTNTLIKTTAHNKCHRSGPKHVVVVHNKIEYEKHLLCTVVLIKVLVSPEV